MIFDGCKKTRKTAPSFDTSVMGVGAKEPEKSHFEEITFFLVVMTFFFPEAFLTFPFSLPPSCPNELDEWLTARYHINRSEKELLSVVSNEF